ncbi:hypothetical protein HYY71_03425 [Candidatus Woesearchaeota archaeon]|nr:hypothetical protein [Candidatus Woesearchaeota archaeon]
MSNPNVGLDIPSLNKSLNELFRANVTRIRRCISVKRVACEKIREDNQEAREYGFTHLRKIIDLQVISYPRFMKNLSPFNGTVGLLKQQLYSIEPLDAGFISRLRFNSAKKNLDGNIALTESKLQSINEKMNQVYGVIEAQSGLLKLVMSRDRIIVLPSVRAAKRKMLGSNMLGDEEAKLRNLISIEENLSEEIISELNGCMEFVFRAVKSIGIIQIRLMKFLRRSFANRGANLIEESQIFCDKIEKHISTFYAFKSYVQLLGICVGFFAPMQEIRTIGFAVAGGAFGLDWIMDWMSGLPETRRIIKKLANKVDAEEENQRQLTAKILGEMQRTPSEIPTI